MQNTDEQILTQYIETLKEREKEFKQSTHFFMRIIDNIQDWVVIVDKEKNKISYMNESAAKALFSKEKEENSQEIHPLLSYLSGCKRHLKGVSFQYEWNHKKWIVSIDSCYLIWKNRASYVYLMKEISSSGYAHYLEHIAYRDELTGTYNRRYGQKLLQNWLDEQRKFSVCFIDIDHLKEVNDQYGHLEGDLYIQSVIEGVKQEITKKDVLCRQGGDEFIILMPETTELEATRCMERICQRLDQKSAKWQLSMSYGVFEVEAYGSLDYQEIIEVADHRMYLMKQYHHEIMF